VEIEDYDVTKVRALEGAARESASTHKIQHFIIGPDW